MISTTWVVSVSRNDIKCKYILYVSPIQFSTWSSFLISIPCMRWNVVQAWWSGPWLNIKMSSYQHRKSHCGDKTVVRSSYLHNGIFYTGKMTSLCWTTTRDLMMIHWIWPAPPNSIELITPGRYGSNFRCEIFERMSGVTSWTVFWNCSRASATEHLSW